MAISVHCTDGWKKTVWSGRMNLVSNIIEDGRIEKKNAKSNREKVDYQLRFLDQNNLKDMIKLQEIIEQDLFDKEIFKLTTKNEFKEILTNPKSVIGVQTKDGLIAYNIVSFPGYKDDNFGYDLNLDLKDLDNVAHLKAVVVHPEFRGNQLQKKLAKFHLDTLTNLGYTHVCSTVSPKNSISIQNHLETGFVIRGLKVKYDNMLRYIMHKNLFEPFIPGPELTSINIKDIEGQRELINQGFAGFNIQRHCNDWYITYGLPVDKLF
jgi:ribosomal protein S18 acetylase RimI-like enzyme